MDWAAFGAIVGLGAAVVALGGVAVSQRQLRHQIRIQADLHRHQVRVMSLSAMIPYTEKYERIMGELNPKLRAKGFWGMPASLAPDDKTFGTFLKYCNLCSEEFYLKQDVLDTELWRVWEGEMRKVFTSEFGRAAWRRAKAAGHFVSHGAFEQQVDAWISGVQA